MKLCGARTLPSLLTLGSKALSALLDALAHIKRLVSAKSIKLTANFLGKLSSNHRDSWLPFSYGFPLSSQDDHG